MHAILRHARYFVLSVSLIGCARYEPLPLDSQRELANLGTLDIRQVVVDRTKPGQSGSNSRQVFDPSDGCDEDEIIALALSLNPELRAKRAELGETQAALITVGAWPNPVVGLGIRPGIGGASGTAIDADILFQLLQLSQRDVRKNSASATEVQIAAELIADEFKLIGEVRLQRLAVFAASRRVALIKQAVDLRNQSLAMIGRQRELGEANALAMSAIELEAAKSKRDLRRAEATLVEGKIALNHLMGLPPEYLLELSDIDKPMRVTLLDDITDKELDRRLLAGRYELRSMEAAYQKSEEDLRLAVLQQYPSLGFGPAFERELDGSKSLGLSLSIELPILDQNQGPIAQKRAAREAARLRYISLLQQLRTEAWAARAQVRLAYVDVDLQEREIIPLLDRTQELFESAYRAREISIIDFIAAQQRTVDARLEHISSVVQYRQAVIKLETSVGQYLSTPSIPASK